MVPVDLDQHVDAERVRLRGEVGDEGERLGNHEAARAGLLDRIADRVEPDGTDARRVKPVEHAREVAPAFRVVDVDVDLLAGERGPQQHGFAVRGPVLS